MASLGRLINRIRQWTRARRLARLQREAAKCRRTAAFFEWHRCHDEAAHMEREAQRYEALAAALKLSLPVTRWQDGRAD